MYIGATNLKNRLLCIFLLITLLSCETTKIDVIPEEVIVNDGNIIPDIIIEPTAKELETKKVNAYIKNMTLEEKIGQLFMFHIRGYKKMNQNLSNFITKYKPGGIIFFSNNIENNTQITTLIDDLQSISRIPLFIGVDEEGGIVSRLGKEKNVDVTHLPPALTVGSKNNPKLAYNSGKILGRELIALGFNMDMAPVADVNTNPANPVIGNRTYSDDPYIVGEMISQVIKGFHEENLIAVIKHFPGHGDTGTDTHMGTVVSPHSRERLDQIEFVPFKKGIEAGVDVIMTAHMTMPGISSTPLPATLNPEIITGILRDDLNFKGIIMTDAMDMGAITNNFSSSEAAILGIKAGIDILLIPGNQPAAYNGLYNNVLNKKISENRINETLFRIISLKLQRGILENRQRVENIDTVTNDPSHIELIKTINKQ